MKKIIASQDKPVKYISDITDQDNIGILMKDGTRAVISGDGTRFQISYPKENRISASRYPDKVSKSKRELTRYFRDNHEGNLKEIFTFDDSEELMTWALGNFKGDWDCKLQ